MPWNNRTGYAFTGASIRQNAPARSGVYGIYHQKLWVYFGESQDIQARLLQHLKGDNLCISTRKPSGFSFELWPSHQRVQRQNQLILEMTPPCNERRG